MHSRAARWSAVRGVIDRRILANYRLDPEAAARQLPASFRPKLVNGYAVGGLCLIRLKHIRPAWVPLPIGIGSENAAHRLAVVWDDHGVEREGVYIPMRDTGSRLNTLVGGRLFPGRHHHALYQVKETADRFEVAFRSDDHSASMRIVARVSDTFPSDSIFGDLDTASRFFENGSLGYSATPARGRFDGLELACSTWGVRPLEVEAVQSSFFDDPERFPPGTAGFDCALLMRGIDHRWHQRGVMCCEPATHEGLADA